MFNDISQAILAVQNECSLSWLKQNGSPAATVVSYVYARKALWMTAAASSPRVRAIQRRRNVALTVSGKGTEVGHTRCIAMQGVCDVLTDQQTRDWFFPLFANAVISNNQRSANQMATSMNNASNALLRFTPEKIIEYDAQAMMDLANSSSQL